MPHRATFIACLLAGSALAAPAFAQQTPAQLEEIVVTARRVTESLQDVPVSVTALSGQSLEDRSVKNITDIGKAVPNLFVREGPQDPSSAFITIRGQAQPDSLITIDPAVGLYVDGVNYPRSFGMRSNMMDVERVEVLRGPQGTLYGKNTTGGAFSVITKNPTDEFGASIKVNAGNYRSYGAQAVVNLPITEGVGLRIATSFGERDKGFGENALGQEFQTESSRFVRAKLKLDPTDNFSVVIAGDFQKYYNGGPVINLGGVMAAGLGARAYGIEKGLFTAAASADPALQAAAAAAYQAEVNRPGYWDGAGTFDAGSRFRAAGGSIDANWDVSDEVRFRSITSYRWYERDSRYDLDASSATIVNSHTITPYDRNITQEIQILGDYDKVKFVAGLYGSDERGKDGSRTFNLGALSGYALNIQDASVISRSLGAFGQASWEFADDWSLTGGFRYTSERKILRTRNRNQTTAGVVTCNVPTGLLANAAVCEGVIDSTFAKPSWLLSLDHNLSDGSLVYAKVSRGFRGGGQNLRGSGTVGSFQPFRPETVTEYEAGAKTELLDRRLRLNASIYYDDLNDVQRSVVVSVGGTATATVVTNAAKARLYGGELEATFRATEALTVSGAVSYNNAKYKRFVDFTGDRSAEDWPTPEWQWNASASYRIPVSFGSVNLAADVYGQSKFNAVPAAKRTNEVTQGAYALVGGRITANIADLDLEIALFGRNLANKKYFTTGIGLEALGYNVTFAGEPRLFGIEITKRFGGERR